MRDLQYALPRKGGIAAYSKVLPIERVKLRREGGQIKLDYVSFEKKSNKNPGSKKRVKHSKFNRSWKGKKGCGTNFG